MKKHFVEASCFQFLDDYHNIGFDSISDAIFDLEEIYDFSEQQAWEIFKEWMRMKQLTMIDEIFNDERVRYIQ